MANNIGLFFNTSKNTRPFAEVLAQVQEYLASKYSTLITDNPEEQRQQITAYIAKYLNDYSLGVEGMTTRPDRQCSIRKAEFSFLTPYLFAVMWRKSTSTPGRTPRSPMRMGVWFLPKSGSKAPSTPRGCGPQAAS